MEGRGWVVGGDGRRGEERIAKDRAEWSGGLEFMNSPHPTIRKTKKGSHHVLGMY